MGYYDENQNWVHVDGEPDPAPMQSSQSVPVLPAMATVDPNAVPPNPGAVQPQIAPHPLSVDSQIQAIEAYNAANGTNLKYDPAPNQGLYDPNKGMIYGSENAVPVAAKASFGNIAETLVPTQPVEPQPQQKQAPAGKPIPMVISTGGSPGGLTMVGRAAQSLVPGAIQAQAEAELAQARGINAGAEGLGNQSDAIEDTLADLADRKPWQDKLRDNQEKAKEAEAKRYFEIAEEEKVDQIDPNHFFKGDYAAGKKVLSIIGMMVGGYLQGLNGGENPFEHTLNTLIERDIDAQRADLHAKGKSRATEKSALALETARWGDQLAAEEKIKANMWEETAHRLDALAKKAGGKQQQENAIAATQMARAHANEGRLKFAELMASRVAYTPGSGGGVRVNPELLARMTPDQRTAFLEEKAKLKKSGATETEAIQGALTDESGVPQAVREEILKASLKPNSGQINPKTKQTMEVSDRLTKLRIPETERLIAEAKSILANTPKGEDPAGFGRATTFLTLPGNAVGRMGGGIPQEFLRQTPGIGLTDEGINYQQTFSQLFSLYHFSMTGQASSAQESARLLAETIGRGNRASLENMIRRMETGLKARKANVLAGVEQDAARTLKSRTKDENIESATEDAVNLGIDFTPIPGTE